MTEVTMTRTDKMNVDTIRILSAEAVQAANSGHPGLPMGAATIAYTLWAKHLKHNPANPKWEDRDRFILSAGHGSALLYSLLHLFGYGLSIEEISQFRQWNSLTPGHPEFGHTVGVEATTGPLGQGFSNGVGMAMAEAYLSAKFNKADHKLVDHYTYVLSGDGCMMEGITSEAASLAGTLGLGKLVVFYDSNRITIEGNTDIAFREDVAMRYAAYNWHVQTVADGNDIDAISKAIEAAKAETGKPSLIIVSTEIGYGCPAKQGKASAHGEPLGKENLVAAKEWLGLPASEPFTVEEEVRQSFAALAEAGKAREQAWEAAKAAYGTAYPELLKAWEDWQSGQVPLEAMDTDAFWANNGKPNATRSSSGDVLNAVAELVPNLIGGSADLAPSPKTLMKNRGSFTAEDKSGSLHFGVRELAMAGIANGLALHGGLIPYVSTFFVFSDYMKPCMRLAAIMNLPVIYVLTHDSIGVGEDGPTHQPIEQLASLRSIPNMTVFRPADTRETVAGWVAALGRKTSPTSLVLTRQNLPQLDGTGKDAGKGGYVLLDSEKIDILLMASGSEVQLVLEAGRQLKEKGVGVRVVSMPSWELFEEQTQAYRDSVLPRAVRTRLAVEAGASFGWHRYVGLDGDIIARDDFGASAPAEKLFEAYGFTVENVLARANTLLAR
jgi:transketolase